MTDIPKRILIACEESQVVTISMRRMGLEAYSCDTEPCSGGHPEWHLQQDVTSLLEDEWGMIIAFPPCTHLSCSGARWWAGKQADGRQKEAIDFFMKFADVPSSGKFVPCKRIAIENPISIMSAIWRKPDQIVQPWWFGHGETKATCLWLKGLSKLKPTDIVEGREPVTWKMGPSPDRSKLRSKTKKGLADAMADQWGSLIND